MAKTKIKAPIKQTEAQVAKGPRRLKPQQYQRGRLQKRIKHPGPKLAGSFRLFKHSLGVLRRNKKLFGGILAIYALLSLVLVKGFTSSSNLNLAKAALGNTRGGSLSDSTALLGNLFSTSGASNPGASAYQSILFIIFSLAIIWALRQVYAKDPKGVRFKPVFYQSMGPLIPFLLVLGVITLQFIPLAVGTSIVALVVRNGIAVSGLEKSLWFALLFMFCLWTFYMLASSIFALYIVTLPDVTPMQALRSAKELVRFRRWTVMRKMLFLPVILFVLTCLIMLPVVMFWTGAAEWVLFVLGLALVIVGHTYFYNLYREMM